MRWSRPHAALVALCLVMASCTGDGAADVPERPAATSGAAGSGAASGFEADVSAFVDCLRRRGVRVGGARFDARGTLTRWLDLPADVSPSDVRDAADACAAETPEVVVDAPMPDPRFQAALTTFVACMRDHGIANMPDPSPQGLVLEGSGVAPDSAAFRRAERTCGHILEDVQ